MSVWISLSKKDNTQQYIFETTGKRETNRITVFAIGKDGAMRDNLISQIVGK